MKIFLDSANAREIAHWLSEGVIDGVTTNPSIMLKDGIYDIEEGSRQLANQLADKPLSVEVTTNDPQEMIRQAREFSRWNPNIVVKVPIINEFGESCLAVISKLGSEHIATNVTAVLSFNQALLASKAGATYVSIFAGRVADEGSDPAVVISHFRKWLDQWGYPTQIIVGSIRSVMDVQSAALAGAHVITIPPQFLGKMLDHKYTRDTVRQFISDAEKAMNQFGTVKSASTVAGH